MLRKKLLLITVSLIFILNTILPGKNRIDRKPPERTIRAAPLEHKVDVDGVLSEPVWNTEGTSGFIQSDPIDGAEPTEKTLVWVAYDQDALYVAARMFDSNPDKIASRLGRRDDLVESDWFIFAVDPYFDRRSGFQFGVNPAGCIADWTLFNDVNKDSTWDGVWEYSSHTDEKGWTVEMRIPFHQLRFQNKDDYVWGVDFKRIIKRKNETSGFIWVPKEDTGYVSHFARLEGLKGIQTGRRIEIYPYVVGKGEFQPTEPGNPFQSGENLIGNTGFDAKFGIAGNMTIDATVNPDFGQVEVDPAVINLSAYETFYEEKRPFFIEGSNMFDEFGRGGTANNININWSNPRLFYSRRIGRSPQGTPTHDGYARIPDNSTILGAFKLTGKPSDDWKLSFINAFTAREYAQIENGDNRLTEEVEPFTYYGVFRGVREFHSGRQGIGVLATSVVRDLRNEKLNGILNDKSFSFALDGWSFLDKERNWIFSGWAGATKISGSAEKILQLQKSSLHYFQRPDTSHVSIREDATSLSGWGGRFQINKQKGQTLFNFALGALSPGFDPNDAGFQGMSSDIINSHMVVGYIWPHPGKILRNHVLAGGPFVSFDFSGKRTSGSGALVLWEGQFLNYWKFSSMLAYNPQSISNTLTRGGPRVIIPYGVQGDVSISTDSRKQFVFSTGFNTYRRPEIDTIQQSYSFGIAWKPRSNFDLSVRPSYSYQHTEYQWVRRVDDPAMAETFGSRYVFSRLQQQVLATEIRLNWIFNPRLTLQAYVQPFLAVGEYDRFKELAQPGTSDYNIYENSGDVSFSGNVYSIDPDGAGEAAPFSFYNPDFNYKSLRGTIVLRWEYHPGSLIYFVWTQNRQDYSHPGDLQFGRDLGDLFTSPGDNIFMLKMTYRWNM